MNARDQILTLQWEQMRHDELYHKEIVLLPVGDRMKHMALHMTKYLGYLVEAIDSHDQQRLERALVDAFIISLASANTLNLDLGGEVVASRCTSAKPENVKALGLQFAGEVRSPHGDDMWFVKQFARHAGRLAKACESLDHVEDYPFRVAMRESTLCLFKLVLSEASQRQLDVAAESRKRLRDVESRHIFHGFYEATRSTE